MTRIGLGNSECNHELSESRDKSASDDGSASVCNVLAQSEPISAERLQSEGVKDAFNFRLPERGAPGKRGYVSALYRNDRSVMAFEFQIRYCCRMLFSVRQR